MNYTEMCVYGLVEWGGDWDREVGAGEGEVEGERKGNRVG